jgi:hypothetical protein
LIVGQDGTPPAVVRRAAHLPDSGNRNPIAVAAARDNTLVYANVAVRRYSNSGFRGDSTDLGSRAGGPGTYQSTSVFAGGSVLTNSDGGGGGGNSNVISNKVTAISEPGHVSRAYPRPAALTAVVNKHVANNTASVAAATAVVNGMEIHDSRQHQGGSGGGSYFQSHSDDSTSDGTLKRQR